MYEKVFQLETRPFISTPDASRFFSAAAIHDALSAACSAIERASGTVIVVGPAGSGKTLFLKMLEEQFSAIYKVVNLACARLTERTELLQSIMFELGQPYTGMSEGELRLGLIDYLKPGEHCPNGILLLVDEAQMLPPVLLDEIRLLTNLVRDGRPRAQLVLAGGVKLEEVLMDASLESFNQRIAARCYLENFSQAETIQFVENAVVNAGGKPEQAIFTEKALHAIHKHTEGCPRLVNQVCDYAMILAATANVSTIDVECVHEAWSDVQSLPNQWACTKSKSRISGPETLKPPKTASQPACQVVQPIASESSSTIEFGQLDESPIEGSILANEEQSKDLRPLSSFTEDELAQPANDAGGAPGEGWTVLEFDTLSQGESEELDTVESYEDSNEQETVLEFGQLEAEVESPVIPAKEEAHGTAESDSEFEDNPAAMETDDVEITQSEANVFDLDEFSETQSVVQKSNDQELTDDRFDDLAKFLANPTLPAVTEDQIPMASVITESVESNGDLEEMSEGSEISELQEDINDLDMENEPELEVPSLGIVSNESSFEVESAEENAEASTGWPEPIYDEDESKVETEVNSVVANAPHPDLFGEPFAQEEVVYDPYAELFARQNRESLHITRQQLNVLDSLVADPLENVDSTDNLTNDSEAETLEQERDLPEIENELEEITTEDAIAEDAIAVEAIVEETIVEEVVMELDPIEQAAAEELEQAIVSFQLESDPDADVSAELEAETKQPIDENELLRSIQLQQDEIASQIYKLKMDFSEGEDEFDPENVDEPRQDEKEQTVTEYPFMPHQFADPNSDDDKDILIIHRQDRIESNHPEEVEDSGKTKEISKGRAIRMEYRELFSQLRAAE